MNLQQNICTDTFSSGGDLAQRQMWYAPDRRIRTGKAGDEAKAIVDTVVMDPNIDYGYSETELFAALHTCAFHATRRSRGRSHSAATRRTWAFRWGVLREYLVLRNLGLVYDMFRRFRASEADDDDLRSDALYALARAVERFNPWRGFRFSTFACNIIMRSLVQRSKQASRYRRMFPVHHDSTYERPEPESDPRMDLYIERLQRVMNENRGGLNEVESLVIERRFPTSDMPRRTLQEIADSLGISKEYVRQIQNKALDKLRDVLDADPVLD